MGSRPPGRLVCLEFLVLPDLRCRDVPYRRSLLGHRRDPLWDNHHPHYRRRLGVSRRTPAFLACLVTVAQNSMARHTYPFRAGRLLELLPLLDDPSSDDTKDFLPTLAIPQVYAQAISCEKQEAAYVSTYTHTFLFHEDRF